MRLTYRAARPLFALLALSACDRAPPEHRPSDCVGGLAKTHVTIPFGGGLQGDVDPKLLAIGRLVTGTNIRQLRQGEWIARPGTAALSSALLGSADTLPAPWALATRKDCLTSLSVVGDHPANAYSPTAGQWATDAANGMVQTNKRGPIFASKSRLFSAGRGADIAYGSGYYFVTWWKSNGASGMFIYQAGFDVSSGAMVFLAKRTVTTLAPRAFGVAVVNGYAVFVRDSDAAAADVVFDYWQISNLDAGSSSTTFATTTTNVAPFSDVRVKDSTTIQVAFMSSVPRVEGIDFVPSTATATGWVLNDATAAAVNVDLAMGWMQDFGGSGKIALITVSAAQGVRVQWDIPAGGATRQAVSTYTLDAAPPTPMANVTGHTRGNSATGEFTVLYDNSNGVNSKISYAMRAGGSLVAAAVLYRSVVLQSKTWNNGTDYYVMGRTLSFTQGTRFVLRVVAGAPPVPLAAVAVSGSQDTLLDRVGSVASPSAGAFASPITTVVRLPGNPATYAPAETGIDLATITYQAAGSTASGTPKEAIDSLFVPGGMLGQFDGLTYSEAGFAQYPEQPTLTPNAAGANTYFYVLVYAYPDVSGRLWRSAPSLPKSVGTNVAVGAGGSVTVAFPTLRLTGRTDVIGEVYRVPVGIASTGTYQKVGTIANDPTVDTVNFVDTVTDALLASGEFLYTNGGILANDAIPGFVAVAVAGNRLFGVSGDDRRVIWVSNEFVPGRGLIFAEDNIIRIDDQHGDLTALSAQPNGIVLAYKADAVYAIGGAGPDAAGNGAFSVQTVSIGLGTTNPRSIVEGSFGAEFKSTSSRAGWYRIGLGLTPEYIGGPVQAYVAETVVGAVLVPALSETRYYTATALVLVHNLVTDVWSVDQLNYGSVSAATAYNGGAAFSASGTVFVDLPGSIADNGNAYDLTLETPWMKMADLKGYQHFYRIQGVGENPTPGHAVSVALFKDFDESGLGTPKSVVPGVLWDWERRYAAKLHALKVKLTVSTGGVAPGPKMSALVIEYGIKQGMGRLAAAKRTT